MKRSSSWLLCPCESMERWNTKCSCYHSPSLKQVSVSNKPRSSFGGLSLLYWLVSAWESLLRWFGETRTVRVTSPRFEAGVCVWRQWVHTLTIRVSLIDATVLTGGSISCSLLWGFWFFFHKCAHCIEYFLRVQSLMVSWITYSAIVRCILLPYRSPFCFGCQHDHRCVLAKSCLKERRNILL